MQRRGFRLAHRRDEVGCEVIHLDRGETKPFHAGHGARLANEPCKPVARLAVAEAPEVHAGENDLAVALSDAPFDLGQHGVRTPAPRRATHERDDAERARERAAVLDLHERARPLQAAIRLDARDRADVAGDRVRDLLARSRDDPDVRRDARERAAEVRGATGDVHALVRPSRAGDGLTRLGNSLVRDAARVHDGDVAPTRDLGVAVAEQPLTHGLRVRVRDLAAQEAHREGRHPGSLVPCDENVCRPALDLEPVDGRPTRAAGRVGGEVARRHGHRRRHAIEESLDDGELDVRHDDVDGRQLVPQDVRLEHVDPDVVPLRRLGGNGHGDLVEIDRDDRREAESSRRDGRHAGSAAGVENASAVEPSQRLDGRSCRGMRTRAERATGIDDHHRLVRRRLDPRWSDPQPARPHRPVELLPAILPPGLDRLRRNVRIGPTQLGLARAVRVDRELEPVARRALLEAAREPFEQRRRDDLGLLAGDTDRNAAKLAQRNALLSRLKKPSPSDFDA